VTDFAGPTFTGLLRAELRRLFSRRAVRVLLAVALLIVLIVEVRAFFVSDRNLDAAHRRAVAEAERESRGESAQASVDACEKARAEGQLPPNAVCPTLGEIQGLSPEELYQDPRLHSAAFLKDGARAVASALAMLGFLIGATFVGAEWHAGTMQALLLWETRRLRVLAGKALALTVGMVAVTAAFQVLVWGGTMLTGATRGTTEGVTAGLQMSTLLTALRGMEVVSFAALLGFAFAGLARVTAAALGAGFAYFVIIENILRVLRPGWERWLISPNTAAVLLKQTTVQPAHAKHFAPAVVSEFGPGPSLPQLHAVRGTITLAIYLAILLGGFAWSFTRRDVT
jgi:ABC-type transport system involved in multi-copper enzyme maturation permease subunit